jgi:hypothetical protein
MSNFQLSLMNLVLHVQLSKSSVVRSHAARASLHGFPDERLRLAQIVDEGIRRFPLVEIASTVCS